MGGWTDSGRLSAAGVSLEYRCWGPVPGDAPTLVMLHEGLGSVAQWRDAPEALAARTGFGVLAYSRAGYGGSDPAPLPRPLDYMEREVAPLGAVMDAVGVRQAVLLGHSDGASIAALYAGSVSDMRVRGLILIAPHFFAEPGGLAAIRAAGKAWETGDLRARLAKHHADPEVAFRGWHDAWTDPRFAAWNIADTIDHWRVPVLAVQGRDDAYGTLAQIEEIDTRIYAPLETLILEDCGHDPLRERREETLAGIAAFCARLDRLEREEVPIG